MILRCIASRRGYELVDRLFLLSMDGRDATAAALRPVTRCVWWSRGAPSGAGGHTVVCIDQIPFSGVNLFATVFPYLSAFSKNTIIRILHADKCFCEKFSFIRNFKCFHKKIFAKRKNGLLMRKKRLYGNPTSVSVSALL